MIRICVMLAAMLLVGCATRPPLVTVRTVEVPGPIVIERVDSALTAHPENVPAGPPRLVFDVAAQRGILLEQAWKQLDAIRALHGDTSPQSPTDNAD